MDLGDLFLRLGVAAGLGLLVGLQRQRVRSELAGIRTFPLITLLGALCALLSQHLGGWVLAAGLLGLAALVVLGEVLRMRGGNLDAGMTTEVAILCMFAVGAYAIVGRLTPVIAVGGGVAVLLQFKDPLHRWAERIGEKDLVAIMQFVLIALVMLPVLPNRAFGPYQVLNPFKLWLLVVLVVGISLVGYLGYKLVGGRSGTLLAGVLGGLISSTATTLSFARQARAAPAVGATAGLVIMLASTVAFARVLALVAVVAPPALPAVAGPLAAMGGLMALLCLVGYLARGPRPLSLAEQENPTQLRPAILFAALFAVVLLAVAFARDKLGSGAVYGIAALAGLTDMDAITLSTSHLSVRGQVSTDTAWRAILVAAMANLVFKAGIVAVFGERGVARRVALLFAVALAGGAAVLLAWPR